MSESTPLRDIVSAGVYTALKAASETVAISAENRALRREVVRLEAEVAGLRLSLQRGAEAFQERWGKGHGRQP